MDRELKIEAAVLALTLIGPGGVMWPVYRHRFTSILALSAWTSQGSEGQQPKDMASGKKLRRCRLSGVTLPGSVFREISSFFTAVKAMAGDPGLDNIGKCAFTTRIHRRSRIAVGRTASDHTVGERRGGTGRGNGNGPWRFDFR
jgi:hypothetical protein